MVGRTLDRDPVRVQSRLHRPQVVQRLADVESDVEEPDAPRVGAGRVLAHLENRQVVVPAEREEGHPQLVRPCGDGQAEDVVVERLGAAAIANLQDGVTEEANWHKVLHRRVDAPPASVRSVRALPGAARPVERSGSRMRADVRSGSGT